MTNLEQNSIVQYYEQADIIDLQVSSKHPWVLARLWHKNGGLGVCLVQATFGA